MELGVTVTVLFAALFHAAWNSMIKGGKNPLLDAMLISCVWLVVCIITIPVLPLPDRSSWLFIAAGAVVHVGYFFLLAKSYHTGELGRVYPIVRGLPPLIVSVVSFFLLGEEMSLYGWCGVAAISMGILSLELGQKAPSHHVLYLSVATAIMIAIYTVIDALGARTSGHSTSFLLWLSLFQSVVFMMLVVNIRGMKACQAHVVRYWRRGVVGGLLSLAAYAIVLWAMTKAPIAYVSALRETSVLFGSIIAVVFLSEPLKVTRIISATFILSGIVIVKLM